MSYQKDRSAQQEKRAASRFGGRVQPASGATDFHKGDVKVSGELRLECKYTTARSFSISPALLEKVEQEARGIELPAIEIEFQGTFPRRRLYVISDKEFRNYLELRRAT
jgi:hypothetical protein